MSFHLVLYISLVSTFITTDGHLKPSERSIGQIKMSTNLRERSYSIQSKIIGGSDAELGEIPYQVSLQAYNFNGGRGHTCGGSIINKYHVVTAAHCVFNKNLRNMDVVAGVNNISYESNTVQRKEIETVTIHPTYNPNSLDGDLAIIKLKSPFSMNNFVKPIRLGFGSIEPSGKCTISGWGNILNDHAEAILYPEILQKAELDIIPRNKCQEYYGSSSVTKGMVCAGVPQGGIGTCNGDSGGPLVCKDSSDSNYLAGSVSWGMRPCALHGEPSVYGNIGYYEDWIEEIISD